LTMSDEELKHLIDSACETVAAEARQYVDTRLGDLSGRCERLTSKYQAVLDSLTKLHQLVIDTGDSSSRDDLIGHINLLRQWIVDVYTQKAEERVYCAYCGADYGKGTPAVKHKALYEHIQVCPEHPLSTALESLEEYKGLYGKCIKRLETAFQGADAILPGFCRWGEDMSRAVPKLARAFARSQKQLADTRAARDTIVRNLRGQIADLKERVKDHEQANDEAEGR